MRSRDRARREVEILIFLSLVWLSSTKQTGFYDREVDVVNRGRNGARTRGFKFCLLHLLDHGCEGGEVGNSGAEREKKYQDKIKM